MSRPTVSVCLPTYNRAHYLAETIESILAQTASDFELLVADNASTDSTPEVVARVKDPRLRYVRNPSNIGHYRNMNQSVEMACGDYVCIVHDDDVYAPRFLERERQLLDGHSNVGMVHCAVYVVDPQRRRLRRLRAYRTTGVRAGRREFVRYLGGHNVCCSTVMFRRRLFAEAGPFEARLMCADWLLWLNFALRADVGYVAEPLVEMRVHPATMTNSMDPACWYGEFAEIFDRGVAMLEAQPSHAVDRARLQRMSARGQGRRFFVAAIAAAARGAADEAARYGVVVKELEAWGLPRAYARTIGAVSNPVARAVLLPARRIRRALGRAALAVGRSR